MIKSSETLFSHFDDKWRTLRNTQAVKSIVQSPVYGKKVGQEGTNGSKTWPTDYAFKWLSSDKKLDYSRLRLHTIKWQHSEIL